MNCCSISAFNISIKSSLDLLLTHRPPSSSYLCGPLMGLLSQSYMFGVYLFRTYVPILLNFTLSTPSAYSISSITSSFTDSKSSNCVNMSSSVCSTAMRYSLEQVSLSFLNLSSNYGRIRTLNCPIILIEKRLLVGIYVNIRLLLKRFNILILLINKLYKFN